VSKKKHTCIICPSGCEIEIEFKDNEIISVTGQNCKKGELYAYQEVLNPMRTIASTVCMTDSSQPLCSVRLSKPVPKKEIFNVMKAINQITITPPVTMGQVIIKNVCGLDSDVIATKNIEQ